MPTYWIAMRATPSRGDVCVTRPTGRHRNGIIGAFPREDRAMQTQGASQ